MKEKMAGVFTSFHLEVGVPFQKGVSKNRFFMFRAVLTEDGEERGFESLHFGREIGFTEHMEVREPRFG